MLSLQLKSGEYITIGEEIVVQVFEESGTSFRVAVKAPREISILRGAVLERTEERPEGLHSRRPKSPSERARNARQMEKLAAKKEFYEGQSREKAAVVAELLEITGQLEQMAPERVEQLEKLRRKLMALQV